MLFHRSVDKQLRNLWNIARRITRTCSSYRIFAEQLKNSLPVLTCTLCMWERYVICCGMRAISKSNSKMVGTILLTVVFVTHINWSLRDKASLFSASQERHVFNVSVNRCCLLPICTAQSGQWRGLNYLWGDLHLRFCICMAPNESRGFRN